jgi:thiosulfate/3-mercaptopyruvate sulfurtransferase
LSKNFSLHPSRVTRHVFKERRENKAGGLFQHPEKEIGMEHPWLIDTQTLDQQLGRPGLIVLDVRGKAAYAFGGHVPGAVHTTWHEYSDPAATAKGLLDPDVAKLERKIRALGIGNESEVVIYSNPFDNWGDEGRMFWMLQYLGHRNLKILDGGWVKWIAEKRRYEYGTVPPTPGAFQASVDPGLAVTKEELKKLIARPHPETIIADARSVEEFAGKEMQGIPRPGHIPSAVSVPWNAFLKPDATVKDTDAIRALLDDKGFHQSHDIICYCTGGVRSAWLYVVLRLCGYPKVRNYPGSWWEWSRDFTAPTETDFPLLHKVLGQAAGKAS